MIFLDYSPFTDIENKYFSTLNETTRYNKIRFENAIFDEVHIVEGIDILSSFDKKEWGYDTVFLWKGGNLEGGNVSLNGIPINQLLIRRRKKDDFTFENIGALDFNPDLQFYEYKDRFVESYEDYVYGIQPMGGLVLGETTTAEIESSFDSVWIVGKDVQYKLMINLNIGGYETVIPTEVIETFGSQYPTVTSNGDVKYRKGNLSCVLASDKTLDSGVINIKEEKKIRRAIMSFLTDRKPKYFKDGSGESMLISIINAPMLTPTVESNLLMYNINIDFVEIGNTDAQSLADVGLIEDVI